MRDKAFLQWVHDRLKNVYGENPYLDFMHKLRAIIEVIPEDQATATTCSMSGDEIGEFDEWHNRSYDNMRGFYSIEPAIETMARRGMIPNYFSETVVHGPTDLRRPDPVSDPWPFMLRGL